MRRMRVVMGVAILHGGRLLAARRGTPPELAGRWELPGGKVEPGEEPTAAAVREIAEELGCSIEVTGWLDAVVPVSESHELRAVTAILLAGDPVPVVHEAVRWLRADELGSVSWVEADQPFLEQLRERMTT